MGKEDEGVISEHILNLYKIFEFEADRAQNYGMFVDDEEENEGQGNDPETQQDDEALILKQEHAKFVMKSMNKLPGGFVS